MSSKPWRTREPLQKSKRTRAAYSVNAAKTNTPINATTAIARRARKNFVIGGDAGTAGLIPPRASRSIAKFPDRELGNLRRIADTGPLALDDFFWRPPV
jgi:hypothetical protein